MLICDWALELAGKSASLPRVLKKAILLALSIIENIVAID
jgi:hypothetical protein